MTTTDELCQLLDERNEDYERRGNSRCTPSHEWVGWYFNLADRAYFYGYPDGHTKLITYRYDYDLTPAQAIAATLGATDARPTQAESSGTCHPISCSCSNNCTNSERMGTCYDTGESRIFHCSECGLGLDDVYIDDEELYPFADFPPFCPFCGAKVVEPTTNDVDAEEDA